MAIKRKQPKKPAVRNRNPFQGRQVPESSGTGINIRALQHLGIAPRHLNGMPLPNRPQAMSQQQAQALPAHFNQVFMEALPQYHEAVREIILKLMPELEGANLDGLVKVCERFLPNHPEQQTEEGLDTEALMKDLYVAYTEAAPPVDIREEDVGTYQAELHKKLGALQFACLRAVMAFVQGVQSKLGLQDDPAIAEASEFSAELDQATQAQVDAVMAEQRPNFTGEDGESDGQKLEEVLGLPAEAFVQQG